MKALPSKNLAEHYKQIKYAQLNSDVFTGTVVADWQQMVDEYREAKKAQGVTEGTLYEIALSFRNSERLVGQCSSKQITQNAIDKFILEREAEVKRPTLSKDIRNLRTFINWCRKKRYMNGEIEIKELKEDERPVKSLNDVQIKKLLAAATGPTPGRPPSISPTVTLTDADLSRLSTLSRMPCPLCLRVMMPIHCSARGTKLARQRFQKVARRHLSESDVLLCKEGIFCNYVAEFLN